MAEEGMREPAGLDGLPPMYSILKGEVVSVTTYGAFVKIPGYKKQGLVHKSEMSSCRVDNPAEIVDVGEQVWIKVIGREMKDDKVKLSFSMKSVNQDTGRDLDPNNVIAEQDERRRRQFRDHTGQKITLEAVLNTTCKKCGCRGHFAKDCFSQPGLQYSLVPEEEEEEQQPPQTSQQTQSEPQKRKKEKKAKKEKKKKEKKRDSSSSDSSDEDAKQPRHSHTHSEKKKKHKKHKHKTK
ncbi:nucleolar protein of 40 kDa-like [Sinocyclocheilus anshuiensis]|uniref:Zinc finger CCHC domain-containing protein 17 n=1 Tax=Sinocyclocheilus anshuiensis TaxID=1608454 RepID=A0A671PJH6_9TELE|nr:PREDICTED: nucleolar protein of 40 kDa-like [Sinocyclocheilus anshuiensis]XP_016317038.1 PREDICTED: nucleolar protein of 40 kDa-like [Sinocyclocheilus anshuiensis]XP_016317047.1 PREDICTED: nucleolar protein of 40 kDa-like [Sinocyclocheilus anshuiensis]